jgi:hypothetical protein
VGCVQLYSATYPTVLKRNAQYYRKFPLDVAKAKAVVHHGSHGRAFHSVAIQLYFMEKHEWNTMRGFYMAAPPVASSLNSLITLFQNTVCSVWR